MSGLDLAFDPDGDISLAGGDLTLKDDPAERARQLMAHRQGDWFLNLDDGIDYDLVHAKGASPALIESEFRGRLEAKGYTVTSMTVTINPTTREVDIDWDGIPPTTPSVVIGGQA